MLKLLLIIVIVLFLGSLLLKTLGGLIMWLWNGLKKLFKIIFTVIGAVFYIKFYRITIPVTMLIIAYFLVRNTIRAIKIGRRRKRNREWVYANAVSCSETEIDDILQPCIEQLSYGDRNDSDRVFVGDNLPYGRVNAFLTYFKKNIYEDDPYYFSTIPSEIDDELREYGIVVTRRGVYISGQEKGATGEIRSWTYWGSLEGLTSVVKSNDNTLILGRINQEFDEVQNKIHLPNKTVCIDDLKNLFEKVIDSKIGLAMLVNQVVVESSQIADEKFDIEETSRIIELAGLTGSLESLNSLRNETKNLMNARQGGGYAAEYANNTIDRLLGHDVKATAQVLDEHGRQVKGGADRTVNEIEIQTKYYGNSSQAIGAVFDNRAAIYIRSDGTGKMMQIEVPRDQYHDALKLMQKRIDSGQVPGVSPGESAGDYVRRGYFTYEQALNVAKAGTVESLTVDFTAGAISSVGIGGISAAIVFANAVWAGEDVETAIQRSLGVGARIWGKRILIYTLTKQLSRAEFGHPFIKRYLVNGMSQGQLGIANPIWNMSNRLAGQISKSTMANTRIGSQLGLNVVKGDILIANSVTGIVMFGPDLLKAVQGKISFSQLVKNSTVTVSSLTGMAIGQAAIPIPGVGAVVGGAVAAMAAEKLMDKFIEDDSRKMFRILKEEFLDVVMMYSLSSDEINEITESTIGSKDLIGMLQQMHAFNDQRYYAREFIMNKAVICIFSKRKRITLEANELGTEKLLRGLAQKQSQNQLTTSQVDIGSTRVQVKFEDEMKKPFRLFVRNTVIISAMFLMLNPLLTVLGNIEDHFISDNKENVSRKSQEGIEETNIVTVEETVLFEETTSTEEISNNYILPYSNSIYYKTSDLERLTKEDLRLARNEVYARHGREFETEDLKQYFSNQPWYHGYLSKEEFDDSVLNEYEKANLDLIIATESGKDGSLSASSNTYLEEYRKAVNQVYGRYGENLYYLYDIDQNGVPELIVQEGTSEADFENVVFTYNGVIQEIGRFSGGHNAIYGDPDEKALVSVNGYMGYEIVTRVMIKGGTLSEEIIIEGDVASAEDYYSTPYNIPCATANDLSLLN
jgi:hypothetical protein